MAEFFLDYLDVADRRVAEEEDSTPVAEQVPFDAYEEDEDVMYRSVGLVELEKYGRVRRENDGDCEVVMRA